MWSLLTVTALITLTACGSGGGNNENAKQNNTTSSETSLSEADAAFEKGKYDPPIEFSSVLMPKKYVQGDTKENNVHDRWMLETLGMKHKDTWYPANDDQYRQKLQLAIASGEKLPDFVSVPTNAVLTNQLIDSGQFIAIDELFDKYANKILKIMLQHTQNFGIHSQKTVRNTICRSLNIPIMTIPFSGYGKIGWKS